MAWHASITGKIRDGGVLTLHVDYWHDDGRKANLASSASSPDAGWAVRAVQARLADLEAIDVAYNAIERGTIEPAEPTPAAELDPAAAAYARDVDEYAGYLRAIDVLGVPITATKAFADLRSRLVENFRPEYLSLFR